MLRLVFERVFVKLQQIYIHVNIGLPITLPNIHMGAFRNNVSPWVLKNKQIITKSISVAVP